MALTPRRHGVKMTEVTVAGVSFKAPSSSIWGLVAVAPNADADVFPLNTPVVVTDLGAAIIAAGAAGTLAVSLKAIEDQVRAIGVVVRVEEGVGANAAEKLADQNAKLIGGGAAGERTGMQALLDAESVTGMRPRIIAAPGFSEATVGAALGILAGKLNAIAYFDAGPTRTIEAAAAFRTGFGQRELFLTYGDFIAAHPISGAVEPSFAPARAVGLRALLDQTVAYSKTISNVPVAGVVGIAPAVAWDLMDENTEAGILNGADVTCLIRRDGFRFWGNRGCSSDPRYAFESAVRTNQVLREIIADGVFPYIDQRLTPRLARFIVEEINAVFRRKKADERIMGAKAFLTEANTKDQLAAGKLRIAYNFTPCAPLEDLGIESGITDEYYADFNKQAA